VKQGHCTHFRGDGFAAGTQLKVYDNDRAAGITTASSDGEFTVRHCFANDAQVGQHVLKAAGANAQTMPSDPSSREVTATVTVTGVEETAAADDTDVNDAQPAASSTSLVSPFSLGVLGLLLMPLLSGLLLLFERRHRRRRRAA
jgi:hypothetical protein